MGHRHRQVVRTDIAANAVKVPVNHRNQVEGVKPQRMSFPEIPRRPQTNGNAGGEVSINIITDLTAKGRALASGFPLISKAANPALKI